MTNVALLPPPDTMLYQPHHLRNLSQWESALNADKHFWTEGREWALRWPYVSAVDGSWKTAFRSPDSKLLFKYPRGIELRLVHQ